MKVLLIEDDHDLGKGIELALLREGYQVKWILNGEEARYVATEWEWDVIILDRRLPALDGMFILKDLRRHKNTPVLMLTALNSLENRLDAFDEGADDYLGKPFELKELLARVKALIRRAYGCTGDIIQYGEIHFNILKQEVLKNGVRLDLTAAEVNTLNFLLLRRGRIMKRGDLEDILTGDGHEVSPNALEVHIHRLRKKVGSKVIQTVRGLGYRIPEEVIQ